MAFVNFFWSLSIEVFRHPKKAVDEISQVPVGECLKFGWCFFLLATLASAGYQSLFITELLSEIGRDPAKLLEMSSLLSSMNAGSVGDLKERMEIIRLSSYFSLFLSPLTSVFFLYLLSGALFVLAKFFSMSKATGDTYEHVIRIVSIGQAPLIFCLIPLIGPVVGNLWSILFIARSLGNLFQINLVGRLSIVAFSFVFLFSVWNSTLSTLASALHREGRHMSVKNTTEIERNEFSGAMI